MIVGVAESDFVPVSEASAPVSGRRPYVPIENRPLLGVCEAAALCGLDEKVVRRAVRRGELVACYAYSSTMRIRRRDLDDWVAFLPESPQ